MKIYVASSWRNIQQPAIVRALRGFGHEVYDFRDPDGNGSGGFAWSDIDPDWKGWTKKEFAAALAHPIAEAGYARDLDGLEWCEVCLLVMPCGRSSHLELGFCAGRSKYTIVLLEDGEPELMYKLADFVTCDLRSVLQFLDALPSRDAVAEYVCPPGTGSV